MHVLSTILCRCEAALHGVQPLLAEYMYEKLTRTALQMFVSLCAETLLSPKLKGEAAPTCSEARGAPALRGWGLYSSPPLSPPYSSPRTLLLVTSCFSFFPFPSYLDSPSL